MKFASIMHLIYLFYSWVWGNKYNTTSFHRNTSDIPWLFIFLHEFLWVPQLSYVLLILSIVDSLSSVNLQFLNILLILVQTEPSILYLAGKVQSSYYWYLLFYILDVILLLIVPKIKLTYVLVATSSLWIILYYFCPSDCPHTGLISSSFFGGFFGGSKAFCIQTAIIKVQRYFNHFIVLWF